MAAENTALWRAMRGPSSSYWALVWHTRLNSEVAYSGGSNTVVVADETTSQEEEEENVNKHEAK